jgi:hypothetical protein
VTAGSVFLGVLVLTIILNLNGSLISDFAYAMVATTVAMLVPEGVWRRIRGGPSGDSKNSDASTEERAEARL